MLLDTSGLLCYHDSDQTEHIQAQELLESPGRKVLHNYVLVEFVALTQARGLSRMAVLDFLETLLKHPLVELVWVDQPLHHEAIDLLKRRIDKAYSLCDAVSFVLMRKHRIADALTTDHHFEQEGFHALLRQLAKESGPAASSRKRRKRPF